MTEILAASAIAQILATAVRPPTHWMSGWRMSTSFRPRAWLKGKMWHPCSPVPRRRPAGEPGSEVTVHERRDELSVIGECEPLRAVLRLDHDDEVVGRRQPR